ncbi:juvenile hormone esterase-like [Anopheles bellator]|uniref:juvenile hormone esterase-like n=1 Tax=Anopheles bellator TaxID=139047 RepID=UPI002648D9E7|nr:juvenile hormone esterase-like [Anopheles bellator]
MSVVASSVPESLPVIVCALIAVCYPASGQSKPVPPFVCLGDGCLRGTWMQDTTQRPFAAYFGIPYARPPVGQLRFTNPQPSGPWNGTFDASNPVGPCIQKVTPGTAIIGSEDCLYLNVYAPPRDYFDDAGRLPVMVYIHGGAFSFGSAHPSLRDPSRIMGTRKVLVVTFQYRLGVMGFLATGDTAASGNFGMKDQVLALRWVQRNIRPFGGDPRRVTIFGDSSAGASVQYHMISPLSRGLFQRAISMSGIALASWSVPYDDPLALAQAQAKAVGIGDADRITTSKLIARLREVKAETLVLNIDQLKQWDIKPLTLYRPTVEPKHTVRSAFLTEDPRVLWKRGEYTSVPWLTGTLPTDGSIATQAAYRSPALLEQFNSLFVELLRLFLRIPAINDAMLGNLKRRYFNDTASGVWNTIDNYPDSTTMVTDALFLYPMACSIMQHLVNGKPHPTSVYSFQFQGRYSMAILNATVTKGYGLTHGDELIYLFRMPLLFPDFPVGSPEAVMSQQWVKYVVDFATTRSAGRVGTCIGQRCDVVQFSNSINTQMPVKKTLKAGLYEDIFKFWRTFYLTACQLTKCTNKDIF